MSIKATITLEIICQHYQIEPSFIHRLDDLGLIELVTVGNAMCIEEQQIDHIDRIMRLHHELEINPEGIDVVFNLLDKINHLEQSLLSAENKLSIFKGLLNQ